MDNIRLDDKYCVPESQIRQSKLFNDILNHITDSNSCDIISLPLPALQLTGNNSNDAKDKAHTSSQDHAMIANYVHYLHTCVNGDNEYLILKQCLCFAHLIEDNDYLVYIINNMLLRWTACGYERLLDELNHNLLIDVYMNVPYHILHKHYVVKPGKIFNGIMDYEFINKWSLVAKDKDFLVDKGIYTHYCKYFRDTGKLKYLTCKRNGDDHGNSLTWYQNGNLREISEYVCGRQNGSIIEYYEQGGVEGMYKVVGGYTVDDSFAWHPNGQMKTHYKRDGSKTISITHWNSNGNIVNVY